MTGGGQVSDQNPNVAEFTITRTLNLATSVTVTYTAGGGNATAGTDYTPVTGTVTFAPGETTKQIVVPILSSGRSEGIETFNLTLSGASAGTVISGASAQVTIPADPALPTLSIGNIQVSDAVAGNASLTVTRSGAIYAPSTVTYTTVGGSAQANSDFTATTGTVTFAAGQATATINIPILANTTPLTTANREGEETFTVELSNAVDAIIANGTGTVTITADPDLPTVTIGDVEVSDTTAGPATLTLTRTGSLTLPSTVTYTTVSGSAIAGSDFTATTGTATFAAGAATATISINILANTTPLTIANREGVESFTVELTGSSNAILGNNSGTVTIGADPVISLSTFDISGGSGVEGGAATVTITRGGDLTGQVSVNYATQPGSATSGDFGATSGTATFAPGETSTTISIGITNDGTTPRETGESFSVVLSGAIGGTIANGTATVTIADDPLPAAVDPVTFSIDSVTAAEGTSATVTVTRSGNANTAVSVNYATSNGSAHAGTDFTAVSGTLTFASGQTTATFSVPITDDGSPESAESFTVSISDPVGGTISNSSALVTIPSQTSGNAPVVLGHLTGSEYIQFDGNDIMSSAGTLNVSSHTVELWTRLGVNSYGPPISLTTIQGTNTGYFYYNSDGTVTVRLVQGSDAKQFTSSETLDVGDWTHLAYSYNETSGLIKIYFDGVEDTGVVIDDNDTFSYVGSGSFFVGSGGPSNFTGGMDNVRVWDTVRSDTQIAENLHNTMSSGASGLQIQYTFEDYTPGTAVNSAATGSSMDGIATGTYFSPNDGDYILHFDGTTYIETPITHSSDSFTLQASIRLSSAGNGQFRPIISKPTVQGGDSDTLEFMLFVDPSDRLVLRMGAGDGNFYDYSGDYLTPGTGYDVTATYDASTGDVGVYVNGVLSVFGSATLANFNDDRQHGMEDVLIGAQDTNGTNGKFYGDITYVRIWDVYMPGATVVSSNQSGVPLTSFGLLANYPFTDYGDTVITDTSGLGHNGFIHNNVFWRQDGAPVVQTIPATVSMEEGTLFAVQLISKDPNGLTVSYSTHTSPSHGTLPLVSGGFVVYKPNQDYVGTDSFILNVSNTNGDITQKTVNINVTAVNDRPSISGSENIDPVVMNDTDPDGETIDSLFDDDFYDPDGTFVGVVVTSNTANDSTQGAWEYSTDSGTSWHTVGTSILTLSNGALLLDKTAQVRFVPVNGYTGNPGGLIIRALDQAYTSAGGNFTSGASRVTLQDALNASRPVIASGISSYIFVSVNAPGASGTVYWTGNTGNWDNAADWDAGVPGIASDAIIDNAGSSVTLNNGTASALNSLTVYTGTLTVDHSGSGTGLDIDQDFTVGGAGTVLLQGGSTITVGDNMDIAASGSVTVGNGVNDAYVDITGTLTNNGTLTLTRGSIAADNFDNFGTFATTVSSGSISVNSTFTNRETGQLNVFSTGGNVTTTIFGNYGSFNNYGDINISNANASAADVSLQLNNIQLNNHAGASLNFSTGAGGGYRAFSGTIINHAASSPYAAAEININHDTKYTGAIYNAGVINIVAGKTLTADAATIYMEYDGDEGSLTGEGTLYLDDTDSQVNLHTEDGFTIGDDLTLRFGSEDSSNSTYWYADGITTLDGTVDLNSGQINGGKFILNGAMSMIRNTTGYDSVSLSGEANEGENSLEIGGTGTLTVAAGALGEDTSLYISQGVLNDGAITLSSAGGNNYFEISLSYNINNPSDPYNESWTNNGLVETSGSGTVTVQSGNLVNTGMGSIVFGANETQFRGRVFNTGSFEVSGGTTTTLIENTEIHFLGSSTLSYSGSGTATVKLYGGTDVTSSIYFENDVTVGADTTFRLGDSSMGDWNDYVGAINDGSIPGDKELSLHGDINFYKGSVNLDVVVKNGATATNFYTGTMGRNVTVESGGMIATVNGREFGIGQSGTTTTIMNGANISLVSNTADGWQNSISFYGTTVNSGTISFANNGASGAVGEESVIIIGGDFTTTDGHGLAIANYNRLEMYDDDAVYINDPGATFTVASGGVVFIHAGAIELNYDLGDNFTLVNGATFTLGNTSGFNDPSVIRGITGVGTDPTLFIVHGLVDVKYADLQVEIDLETGGELRVENGTLDIQEDLDINAGAFNIADAVGSATNVTAHGDINNNGGTISLSSPGGLFARLTMSTGKTLHNYAAGTINFVTGNSTQNLIVGAVENAGDINVAGRGRFSLNGTDLENNSGGDINVTNGGQLYIDSTGTPTFYNAGTLKLLDTGTISTIDVTVNNSGDIIIEDASDGGSGTQNTTLAVSAGLANSGDITLKVSGGSHSANIDFTDGFLSNNSGGSLIIEAGAGVANHTVTGNIDNNSGATISIGDNVTFELGSGTYIDNIAGGVISFSGSGATAIVNASGSNGLDSNSGIALAAGNTLKFTGSATYFHRSSASLSGSGTLFMDSGTTINIGAALNTNVNLTMGTVGGAVASLTKSGAYDLTVSGTTTLNNANIDTNVFNAGDLFVIDNGNTTTTITGDLTNNSGAEVRIEDMTDAGGATGNSQLNVLGALTNSGTISLAVSGGSHSANLNVTGAITNSTIGVINVETGTGAGPHTITGNLSNSGDISVEADATFNFGSSTTAQNTSNGDIFINDNTIFAGTGKFSNYGTIQIANGKSLKIDSGLILAHESTADYSGTGTLNIADGATFQLNSNLSNGHDIVFGTGAGAGAAWTGGYTAVLSGNVSLKNGTIAPALYTSGNVIVAENGNVTLTVSNNWTNIGTIDIQDVSDGGGGATGNTQINVAGVLSNNSQINMTVIGGTHSAIIDFTGGGRLDNGSSGTLNILSSAGGGYSIVNGHVENAGDINVYDLAAFNIGNDDFDNLSTGEFHVYNGGTASFTSGSADFVNYALGTVVIDAGGTMIMGGTNITNAALGIFTVNGHLYMGDGAGGSAVGGGDFTNIATGVLSGSGTIHMEGGGFSGLDGGVTVAPGNSPGRLTIDGDLQFGVESELELELAGTERSQYDLLTVTGRYGLAGTLTAISYAGFAAAAGDRFDVVEWGSRTGMFDEAEGLDGIPGVALDMDFRDDGLALTAKAITAEGDLGDDTLIGTALDDVLVGRDGDDMLDGGAGDDLLLGGAGDDLLKGGEGANRLIGGEGDDTADYSAHIAPINVDLSHGRAAHATGADTIISVENIIGTDAADTIVGNARDNVIAGGKGADILTGGAGNDTFVLYGPAHAGDTITDFTSGEDVIELNAASFGFAPDTEAGACFTVIGGAYDGQNGGNAALIYSQADHTLYFATNGAPEGYVSLATLQPNAVLTANDIRLTEQVA